MNLNDGVVGLALAVAAVNAVPTLLGGWRWYRDRPSRAFWWLVRAGQVAALVLALVAGGLVIAGRSGTDNLFFLYAALPVVIGFVAEQLRITSAQTVLDQLQLEDAQAVGRLPEVQQRRVVESIVRREMGIMALSTLVVLVLATRAAGTAHGF
jgi:hypothetical protein